MKYENYKEEFLEKQVELVNEVTKDWQNFGYPDVEQLKEAYSREGFTPETRHYIFDDNDELVGLCASAIEEKREEIQYGSIQIPFIKNGDTEIEKKLMSKAINTLKEKGVDVIYTSVRNDWPGTSSFIERNGYQNERVEFGMIQFELDEFDTGKESRPDEIMDFDFDEHIDIFYEATRNLVPLNKEELINLIKQTEEDEFNVQRLVVLEEGKMLAQARLGINTNNEAVFIPYNYVKGKEHYRFPLIKELIKIAKTDKRKPKTGYIYQAPYDTDMSAGYDFIDQKPIYSYRYEIDLRD